MNVPIQAPAVRRAATLWSTGKSGPFQGIIPQDKTVICNGVPCSSGQVCCPKDPNHSNPYCYQCAAGEICCGPDISHANSYCAMQCG
jgi:hypothetical protein